MSTVSATTRGLRTDDVTHNAAGSEQSTELHGATSDLVDRTSQSSDNEQNNTKDDKKSSKRGLFGLGRKKEDVKGKVRNKTGLELVGSSHATSVPLAVGAEPLRSAPNHPYMARSPDRNLFPNSPRAVSPAGSQIFERDVQDSTLPGPMPTSPAVPGHLQVDDHIPSVLDASSEAITNPTLSPDTVEIVMHSSHQPAAVTVTGIASSESMSNSWGEDLISHPDKNDAASNYGALDATDVRRLSFISFADVVQSEHTEHAGSRDPIHIAGLTALSSGHRSPSPIRSPVSSQGFDTSPPTSKSASVKGMDMSPNRGAKPMGSPALSAHAPGLTGSELMIQTMSQALRKTQSGDLGGARSPTTSDALSESILR